MRKKCEIDLKQMYHCRQCRADAIGMLSEDRSADFSTMGCGSNGCEGKNSASTIKIKDKTENEEKVYRFAISSKSGINIDQHFGHTSEFYIYNYVNGKIEFVEKRSVEKYCNGVQECGDQEDNITKILNTIKDCNAVLAFKIGVELVNKLLKEGIQVYQMYERINEGIVKAVELLEADANVKNVKK